MKRIIGFVIVWAFSAMSYSQTISVSSFNLLDTDLTANTAGTMEQDQNGETAALIKVVTTQTGFTFDGGAMGIVKTKQTPGEIWVYIPRGSKKISIKHSELGVLRDYYFPLAIEAARTYEMVLVAGEVQTIIRQTRKSQYVVFQLTPPNAVVELDGELLETINGVASKMKNLGTYNYRVQAPNYFLEAGSVTIDDPLNKKFVKVSLNPNFAHLTVLVDNDAEIWINGEKKGVGNWTGDIGSGVYEFEAKKQGHHSSFITQEIKASSEMQTIKLQAPSPIYGEINIMSNPPMSDVYLDGKLQGQSPLLVSELLVGKHTLVVKHDGYCEFESEILVEENKVTEINASLNNSINVTIDCNFPSAELFIDGKSVGSASGIKELGIGEHKIEVNPKANDIFMPYSKIVKINGSTSIMDILLETTELDIYFNSDLKNTYLFVDDELVTDVIGNSLFKKTYKSGEHTLKFRHAGQNEIMKTVVFSSARNSFEVSFKKKEIYVKAIKLKESKYTSSSSNQEIVENDRVKSKCSFSLDDSGYASKFPVYYENKKGAYLTIYINGFGPNGFFVDCGNNNILKRQELGSLLYLFVKEGTKEITIRKDNRIICNYTFEIPIKEGLDYKLIVNSYYSGTQKLSNGKYTGEFLDDKPHGHGVMVFNNGDKYDGDWENGQLKKGKYTFANGETYDGEWANNKRHGLGKCIYVDGHVYEGAWVNDAPSNYTTTTTNTTCIIRNIQKNSNETKIYMTFKSHWRPCSLKKNTYIQDSITKQMFELIRAEGIAMFPQHTEASGDVDFVLIFPALPKTIKKIDLIEPDGSDWKFYGINLDKYN